MEAAPPELAPMVPPPKAPRWDEWLRRHALYIASASGAFVWAVFLNFYRLNVPAVQGDEWVYATAAYRYVHGQVGAPLSIAAAKRYIANSDNFEHPPLGKWIYGIAQLLVGDPTASITADRAVAALATIATGIVLAVWIGRVAGRWVGLLAGAMVAMLPESYSGLLGIRFGRFALLDPLMELFALVALAVAWEWLTRRGRAAWAFAVLCGLAVGCAAATKENGGVAAVFPFVLGIGLAGRDRRLMVQRVLQTVAAAATAGVAFLLTYAPFSHRLQRLRYLLAFQTSQSKNGHIMGFAGRVTTKPPWWANLWFAEHGLGRAATVFLLAAAVFAVVFRRDLLTWFLVAALAGPFLFHCFIAGAALPFYWTAWLPPLVGLAALGFAEAAGRARSFSRFRPLLAAGLALSLLAPVWGTVALTQRTASVSRLGPQVLESVLARNGVRGTLLSSGIYSFTLMYYLPPQQKVVTSPPESLGSIAAVVIGAPACRLIPDNRTTRAIAAANLASGRITPIHVDREMTVYKVIDPLEPPSPADIARQPPTDLAAHC